MAALTLTARMDDRAAREALKRIARLGEDASAIMRPIAFLLENSSRGRFQSQTSPEGEAWPRSLRAKLLGGKTLTRDGHLGDSITSEASADQVKVGSNRIYAAIHQFGGIIRAKTAKGLAFELADGTSRVVMSVTMPARPYLGISADDERDIQDVVHEQLEARLR